ncbi:Pyridine nucleotide-disulfide oxidoreductase family protein [Aspergillus niger]|uniref:Pyridine nucleotide-disulfide oxidoreductase family protein n=1 Tax=Aspergillus niger TaxID=5061 RepID=A0A505HP02_ASPNG|nr:Pyridine nucleotide-disulfide oxidoreductase family protein [Aspergillus niger]
MFRSLEVLVVVLSQGCWFPYVPEDFFFLESIQHRTLYRVIGAFRTTSRAAIKICSYILPPPYT